MRRSRGEGGLGGWGQDGVLGRSIKPEGSHAGQGLVISVIMQKVQRVLDDGLGYETVDGASHRDVPPAALEVNVCPSRGVRQAFLDELRHVVQDLGETSVEKRVIDFLVFVDQNIPQSSPQGQTSAQLSGQ